MSSYLSGIFSCQIVFTYNNICSDITNENRLSNEGNSEVKFKRNTRLLYIFLCIRQLVELILVYNSTTKVNTPTKYMLRFLADDKLDNLKANGKQLTRSVMFDLLGDERLRKIYKDCSSCIHNSNIWYPTDNKKYNKIVKDDMLEDYKYMSEVFNAVDRRFDEWSDTYFDDVSEDEVDELLKGLDWVL